jgi:integrase
MLNKIQTYLNSKERVWAASTLKSETARLTKLAPYITGDALVLWEGLIALGYEPYSRTTAWIRVVQFWTEAAPGPNPYAIFKDKNPKLFSQTYQRRVPKMTFAAAEAALTTIEDAAVRAKCLQLLHTGMRWKESDSLSDGHVLGKGNKVRRIFASSAAIHAPYNKVREALATHGLTPHDLRKLFAMELVRRGATVFQLKKALGWSNLNTAQSYIEADDSEIEALIKGEAQ